MREGGEGWRGANSNTVSGGKGKRYTLHAKFDVAEGGSNSAISRLTKHSRFVPDMDNVEHVMGGIRAFITYSLAILMLPDKRLTSQSFPIHQDQPPLYPDASGCPPLVSKCIRMPPPVSGLHSDLFGDRPPYPAPSGSSANMGP